VRRSICAAVLLVVTCMARGGRGGPQRCESIVDGDLRHHCRATTLRKPIYCESIVDGDLRHLCRAIAGGKSIYCESIRNRDTRQLCRAIVGR
jgi:hypothetical protein